MMKRHLCILMSGLILLAIPTFAFADEGMLGTAEQMLNERAVETPVVLDCRDFSYTLDSLSEDDATVVKTKDSVDAIEYEVYNKMEPGVIDTIRVDFSVTKTSTRSTKGNDIRSTFFSAYKTIKNTKTDKKIVELEFSTRVDFYESGSFRAFYKADTPNVSIYSSATPMELTNTAKSVKSTTGKYPTSSLTYAYSTNLKTGVDLSTTVSAQLPGAGFSASTGTHVYYYRTVKQTGTINLY